MKIFARSALNARTALCADGHGFAALGAGLPGKADAGRRKQM